MDDNVLIIIDAGMENIHIKQFQGPKETDILMPNNDEIEKLFKGHDIKEISKKPKTKTYITGKLAEVVRDNLNCGEVVMPSASLWSEAKYLAKREKDKETNSIGIIDLSASGYMIICVDRNGCLKEDLLIANPKCGAGTGINLKRILEKLGLKMEQADVLLKDYLGEEGREKRAKVNVRSDRCGVFSSSATISDKNQGIPLDFALAVTMKSEVLKACKRMIPNIEKVYLTGRVFNWQYTRDCAADYLKEIGVKDIVYDNSQSILLNGTKHLVESVGEAFRKQPKEKLRKPERLNEYPSFQELKREYEKSGSYKRLPEPEIPEIDSKSLIKMPVNIALDVGSTMAKMVIADSLKNNILFKNSYENHGDTVETIKHIFRDLKSKGVERLKIQHIGITGSGRYQVQKVLREVYPKLGERIFALVENYAHAYGSIEYAKEHIHKLKKKYKDVNEDFCVLVDIGGEDTKVSVISLKKGELYDNVMNIKCSAGTGSLMDTLKALFNIDSIKDACNKAYNSKKAYEINATCAVFLMENAKKMQALGYGKDEILASCNYAIVENMARSLWNQIEFPKKAVVLLHGQTMLSEPLPLAVTRRIQESSKMYCLVPPFPGHRACIGLIKYIKKDQIEENFYALDELINVKFNKKIIMCRGAACGDKNACCARTCLSSEDPKNRLSLTLGGCSAVNELSSKKSETGIAADAYKGVWEFINSKMPRSEDEKRLIIPRSFAVSEQAFFLAKIFERIGIPVYVDNVRENDILEAQPLFRIDVCAPLIGAVGQFLRLAKESHGIILVPQIDFLPTGNASIGRTCTTNQGGVIIAKNLAKLKNPSANFLLFDLSLDKADPRYIASQLFERLKKAFDYYKIKISKQEFAEAIEYALEENRRLKDEAAEKAAAYLEEAIEKKLNVSIVCGREYILNPEIYDSHIGKLLKDKGIIALPSYAFETEFDKRYSYIYWRNPHDILTKIDAITNKRFHKIIKNPRLRDIVKRIENGLTDSLISAVEISTFRCGPDTVTTPTINEVTKNAPHLFIQSDAMIKELAHLENRVNTYINQLNKRLHEEFARKHFKVELVENFGFNGLNKDTDVVYFPTLSDNRMLTSIFRGAGITTIDNYEDELYDLEEKVRLGRKYAGDAVCAPLAGVFADILLAVEDFIQRKKRKDPIVKGKSRVLVFDNKGTGPCRQGQYYEMHKLLLHRKYSHTAGNVIDEHMPENWIRLMVGTERDAYNVGLDEWALIQSFQSVIIQAILHSILLKAGACCRDYEEYREFFREFIKLKEDIYRNLENNVKPNRIVEAVSKYAGKKSVYLGAAFKYFGYGLYNNNGLRKIFRKFAERWINSERIRNNSRRIKVYVEGEAYMRVAQVEDIFNSLVDSIGFNSFEMGYSPLWSYFELLLEFAVLNFSSEIEICRQMIDDSNDKEEKKEAERMIKEKKLLNNKVRNAIKILRSVMAKPLYEAARVEMPHEVSHVLENTERVLPTLKPHGELPLYLGEAIIRIEEGTDLFFNVAPEGCMPSSMGQVFTPSILDTVRNKQARIQNLFTLNGEINEEQLRMSLLKTLGPERYYEKQGTQEELAN